jgi:hypothetical protein
VAKRDYVDFQDRRQPLAYLITFRCYGTWLHGEQRGSTDRRHYNRYGTPDMPVNKRIFDEVHSVVGAGVKPEHMMNSFKSYATRKLRESKLLSDDVKPWARHGSTPYLWTEDDLERAIDYVLNGQGDEPFR